MANYLMVSGPRRSCAVVDFPHFAVFQPVRVLLLFIALMSLDAATAPPIRYVVRISAPESHYAGVEAIFPIARESQLELFLPVWTPGSYMVREYSRNLE